MRETQEELVYNILKMNRINSIDERGYYIVNGDGNSGGVHYLYADGIIRDGVRSPETDAKAFWPTETDALSFFITWAMKQRSQNNES